MMRKKFYLSFPSSSEINVLSDMALTAILAVLGTSLYFCSEFQTVKAWDTGGKKVIITKACFKAKSCFPACCLLSRLQGWVSSSVEVSLRYFFFRHQNLIREIWIIPQATLLFLTQPNKISHTLEEIWINGWSTAHYILDVGNGRD